MSLPSPPYRLSFPSPPMMTSSPPPALIVSCPPFPRIVLALSVPSTVWLELLSTIRLSSPVTVTVAVDVDFSPCPSSIVYVISTLVVSSIARSEKSSPGSYTIFPSTILTDPCPSATDALLIVRVSPMLASVSLARTSISTVFCSVTAAKSALATGPSFVSFTEIETISLASAEPSEAVTFTQKSPESPLPGVPDNWPVSESNESQSGNSPSPIGVPDSFVRVAE